MTATTTMTIEPRTRHIGADVAGVDLGGDLSDEAIAGIRAALHEHLVLFFHDQEMAPEAHSSLAARLGEVEQHEYFKPLEGFPHISVLEHDAERPPISDTWHSDVTYRERPSMASILYARDIPQRGGDTLWLSAYAAYETLSEVLQAFLATLHAEHDFLHGYGHILAQEHDGDERLRQARKVTPPVVHPLVVTHPVTGRRILYVNRTFTHRIVELSAAESSAILEMLFDHLIRPDFQVRLKWRENDVAIWDNRATQHYATADYYPAYRRMHRVTVGGDRPVGVAA